VRLLCNQIAVGFSHISLLDEMRRLKERFEGEATFYRKEIGASGATKDIIGKSPGITSIVSQIHRVAPTDSSVLITGETGVGKELVAKAVHNGSNRKDGPFIPVNLAALPQELVASELFGHEKGAFTGANDRHKGRFELADGGTIFLDEVGDLPLSVQVRLLRVLQEGTFERLGSAQPIVSDFRIVAATNKDLAKEVKRGRFRQDLFFRLNVFPIVVPPLRERKEDIPLLTTHFMDLFGRKMDKPVHRVRAQELKKLESYDWPGNVRELKHFVEKSLILWEGGDLRFPIPDQAILRTAPEGEEPMIPLHEVERRHIERVLHATRWRVSGPDGAAAILEMKPTTLLYRMQKLGITRPPRGTGG
jgi:transcriptional regulator with GAF, ATPase, and Fis domain